MATTILGNPQAVNVIISEELQRVSNEITDRSEAQGQKASGKTYREMQVQIGSKQGEGRLLVPEWFFTLETGRGPGKLPRDFWRKLATEWVGYKGIQFSSAIEEERFLKAVEWKIRRYGTKLFRSGRRLDIYSTPVKEFEGKLMLKLEPFYETEIITEITNGLIEP